MSRTKEQALEYYYKHKARILELQKIRIKNNPNYHLSHVKAWRKYWESPKGIYKALQQNSKTAGRPIILQRVEFLEWYKNIKKKCFYCKMPEELVYITRIKRFTIDRVDNNKPYSIDNIVLACDWCNQTKGALLNKEEMLIIGKIIIKPKWKILK